jgi:hypothetical protein
MMSNVTSTAQRWTMAAAVLEATDPGVQQIADRAESGSSTRPMARISNRRLAVDGYLVTLDAQQRHAVPEFDNDLSPVTSRG